jgi:hypothetical protein
MAEREWLVTIDEGPAFPAGELAHGIMAETAEQARQIAEEGLRKAAERKVIRVEPTDAWRG